MSKSECCPGEAGVWEKVQCFGGILDNLEPSLCLVCCYKAEVKRSLKKERALTVIMLPKMMPLLLSCRPPDPVRGCADAPGEAEPPAPPAPQPEASETGAGQGGSPRGPGLPL